MFVLTFQERYCKLGSFEAPLAITNATADNSSSPSADSADDDIDDAVCVTVESLDNDDDDGSKQPLIGQSEPAFAASSATDVVTSKVAPPLQQQRGTGVRKSSKTPAATEGRRTSSVAPASSVRMAELAREQRRQSQIRAAGMVFIVSREDSLD
jgi:hypothetical protein